MGILEGLEPAGEGLGWGRRGAEEALATMYEMGYAVGFSDTKEKEGVGNEELTAVPETLEPEITEAPEEVEPVPEALEAPEVVEGAAVEVTAPVDEAMS